MLSRFALAAVALVGAAALATPALAIEQFHIPDSSAAQNSGPPDALFDNSIPSTWQKKSDSDDQSQKSSFHFSVSGSSNFQSTPSTASFGEDAKVPGSEFYQNGQTYPEPLFQH